MAIVDEKAEKERPAAETADALDLPALPRELEVPGQIAAGAPREDGIASGLGSSKYVHAAFFAAGILAAFLASKVLGGAWTHLSEWPTAVHALPQLVAYSEEQRDGYTMAGGAILGGLGILLAYRRDSVRNWATEVASELSKVTWPNRDAVMNGAVVVIVASMIAAVYVAVLDRFWSFLTTWVYGA